MPEKNESLILKEQAQLEAEPFLFSEEDLPKIDKTKPKFHLTEKILAGEILPENTGLAGPKNLQIERAPTIHPHPVAGNLGSTVLTVNDLANNNHSKPGATNGGR